MSAVVRDPWSHLGVSTNARIALGRAGGSLRTATQLELRLAHARARDALLAPFDGAGLLSRLLTAGIAGELTATCARSRQEYLMDPELGRSLSEESRRRLAELRESSGGRELVIVVSDGLSALAAECQVEPLLRNLFPLLERRNVSCYPVLVAPFARVKLGDDIGAVLGARLSLVLLGERPGLSSPDSLGAYLTYGPEASRTDADRNCVSNIRAEGLPPAAAANGIARLIVAALLDGRTGVALKLDPGEAPTSRLV